MSQTEYVRCFRDLCQRGVQYCVEEKKKCYLCEDVAHLCGQPRMPWQCDSYCKEQTIRELLNNITMSVAPEPLIMAVGIDSKWLILTSVAAVAFFLLSVCLAVWICILKRKSRGQSVIRSVIKPGDGDNEEDDVDNSTNEQGDLLTANDSVAIEMPEITPNADQKPMTTNVSTSMTSLLEAHRDDGNDASEPSADVRLSVENTGCPGPRDICMRNLPDPMKQMPPKETDRIEHCFS